VNNNKKLRKRINKKMREINSSVKKYFLNFFVLEERREKRKPGPFAIQAIPNTNNKIKKASVKERLANKEHVTTFQTTSGPRTK
jgi:hypothetical protein